MVFMFVRVEQCIICVAKSQMNTYETSDQNRGIIYINNECSETCQNILKKHSPTVVGISHNQPFFKSSKLLVLEF